MVLFGRPVKKFAENLFFFHDFYDAFKRFISEIVSIWINWEFLKMSLGRSCLQYSRTVAGICLVTAMIITTTAKVLAANQCLIAPQRVSADAVPAPLAMPEWKAQYERLKRTLAEPTMASRQLVFIGDSLTYGWHKDETLFYTSFKTFKPLNLGIYGDRTESVIYRLKTDWGALNPKVAVVLIGTNNTANGSQPADVAFAITEVVRAIRVHTPSTRVLIVSILPRGETNSALRRANDKVNELVSKCADGKDTVFADIGQSFVDGQGRFRPELTTDNIHLTQRGYIQLASLILPTIKTLMDD
jgi:beta-glucosidase